MLYLSTRNRSHSREAQRALNAADGYLYLGLPDEALAEMEALPKEEQTDAAIMLARIRTLLHLKRWQDAEELSHSGETQHPDEDEFTVQRAFALHQLRQGDAAIEVLLAAPDWIRRTGILHYNLACYEARLGDLSIARQCINAAIQMNAAIQKKARIDPDLAELWN
jgi:predicted Zn-dependent protease